MVNDSLGDTLAQIKNGYLARKKTVVLPSSKLKLELVKLLVEAGYLSRVTEDKKSKQLTISLKYEDKNPAITDIKRVSKPSLRVYVNHKNIPVVLGGLGIMVISTPKGLKTGSQAKIDKLGGELICKIW